MTQFYFPSYPDIMVTPSSELETSADGYQTSADGCHTSVVGESWRVVTLYWCIAAKPDELSFESGQIINNVKPSNEIGWLIGTLNGVTGLIPENYCKRLL